MLLGIGVVLGLVVVSSTSYVNEVAFQEPHRLEKRDWVLDCDNSPVPVERQNFETLSDLCKGYPHGFGLICDNRGNPTERTPHSLIARTYGNDLAHVCLNHCRCSDLAPDAPTIQEALDAQFNECSMSNDTVQGHNGEQPEEPSASATCSHGIGSAFVDSCTCNEYWYGNPVNADCSRAMARLPDHGATTHKLREFLPEGQNQRHTGVEGAPVRTPLISTYGHCSVAVLLPEGPGTTPSMMVDTLELNQAADELREHCVQSDGVGGKFHQTSNRRLAQVTELPDIIMYAPDSKWKEFLEMKYQCIVDNKGSSKCKSSSKQASRTKAGAYGAWRYMGTIGKQGWTKLPSKDSNKQKCRGSCLNPTDCDVDSDCLCASTRGVLLSSTWGQHSCMYVAGAAAAIAAAAIKQPVCRGRCLLQPNETLAAGGHLNSTNTTFLSFDSTDEPVDVSYPSGTTMYMQPTASAEIASTTVVLGNTTDSQDDESEPGGATSDNSTALGSYPNADPSGPEDSNTAINTTDTQPEETDGIPTVSNSTDDVTYGNTTTPPPEYAIFNDTSSNDLDPLTCPCNCTYVSAACCLSDSGIVYEDPSMQVPMTPIPDDEPICCDPRSGQFLWKSSGECDGAVVNGTASNFIDLGERLWNSTFDLSVGFPDDDNDNI